MLMRQRETEKDRIQIKGKACSSLALQLFFEVTQCLVTLYLNN